MKFKLNENVLRVALILFSTIFGILSVSLIALGIVYTDDLSWPERYVGIDFLKLPTMLIVLGSLSLAMAIVGCVCSKSYNRKLLITFGVLLFVILCFELTISIIAFRNVENHEEHKARIFQRMLADYNQDKVLFETVENHYDCCGVNGSEAHCEIDPDIDEGMWFKKPACLDLVDQLVQDMSLAIGSFAVVFMFLQVLQITCNYLIQDHVYHELL